jgi:hypothetical protein
MNVEDAGKAFLDDVIDVPDIRESAVEIGPERLFVGLNFLGEPAGLVW